MIGQRLGSFEVLARLGEGGMGEVYRARDTKLNRDVALKVLPDTFARDPDRLSRFKREAQPLAALSHPSIGVIHGLEEVAVDSKPAISALVLELVEGETLADRIARGPLPLDEALPIARQIAEALEAAHDQGIVHRDLKPSNIKVRPDGTVKVLDFGLAKLTEGYQAVASGLADLSPTITSPAMTGLGVILGTAAYMSPEQARGKVVDKRTDVWAFGCVLYEMLTGRRAFDGEDATDTIASIVRGTPDWNALPADLPPGIRLLVQRCLEKDRRQRIGDISTALFLMREATDFRASRDVAGVTVAPAPRRWRRAVYVSAAILAAALISGLGIWTLMRSDPPQLRRLEATIDALPLAGATAGNHVAITRDASTIVYVTGSGPATLRARPINELESKTLAERAVAPFVSPDGEWIGFFSFVDQTIKRVSVSGGPPVEVAPFMGNPRGGTWGDEGSIVFATVNATPGLQRVRFEGGKPTALTTPDRQAGEGDHVWPRFLPGGHAVLFTILAPSGDTANAQIAVLDLRSPNAKPKVLLRGGSDARYVDSGHLVYLAGTSLRAIGFDLNRLETVGTAVPVLPRVDVASASAGEFDVAADGTLVYSADGTTAQPGRTLVWVDRRGKEIAITAPPKQYLYPRISWKGDRVAVDVRQDDNDIWTIDLASGVGTRVTKDPALDRVPIWTRNDTHLLFGAGRGVAVSSIYAQASDGTGEGQQLTKGDLAEYPTSLSEDGSTLLFHHGAGALQSDIMKLLLPPTLAGKPRATPTATTDLARGSSAAPSSLPSVVDVVKSPSGETNAEVSPDGRWMVYQSNETGSFEIYVLPYPDPTSAPRETVSKGGGMMPHFSRKNDELFYMTLNGNLMSVPLRPGKTWRDIAGQSSVIFDAKGYFYGDTSLRTFRMYDVSEDGRKFLMLKPVEAPGQSTITPRLIVVENWFEELKRLVPGKK
ncbi:MAG TPA: protein kinase [Vicinamibacterales bacterium]|nr:protein kinase [Vicinamibacterales bacterium]